MIFAYVLIIIILAIIILFLSLTLYNFIKKYSCISDKEKDFVTFAIDMYIKNFAEITIESKDQQEKLIQELEKIKNKHFKTKQK